MVGTSGILSWPTSSASTSSGFRFAPKSKSAWQRRGNRCVSFATVEEFVWSPSRPASTTPTA